MNNHLPILRTFTSYGRGAGSARVRVFDWLDWTGIDSESEAYLGTSSNSLSTMVAASLSVLQAEFRLRRTLQSAHSSTVLISRQASPLSNGALESQLLTRAQLGVYDFDDALMYTPRSPRERLWSKRTTWGRATAAADVVVAGNDYLADRAAALNDNVVVIPSCVNPAHYERKTDYRSSAAPRAVWIGSPSTEHYLQLIEDALLTVHASTGLRLTLISNGTSSLGSLDAMVDRVDWTPNGFSGVLASADFGIMPLTDNEWTRGKCAYKLLQYGAAGLPLVGSPVGTNATVLVSANGLSPTTTDEWVAAMEEVSAESTEMRRQRGKQAYEAVTSGYSFSAWEARWKAAMGLASL